MKALSARETENLMGLLATMVGCKLQAAEGYAKGLVLRFYGAGGPIWCIVEMDPVRPLLLLTPEEPKGLTKSSKPLVLFLKAHLLGKPLTAVTSPETRVLKLELRAGSLEVRLFPHGENVIAEAGGKSVSWNPVLPLQTVVAEASRAEDRNAGELLREWQELRVKPEAGGIKPSVAKTLEKKRVALTRLQQDLAEKEASAWSEAGEHLKASQSLDVPARYEAFVDRALGLAENIQRCFNKAKDNKRKIMASRAREAALISEIEKLEAVLNAPTSEMPGPQLAAPAKKDLSLKDMKLKARRLDLESGKIAYLGRSAADNLALLRAANSWDLWLHMKDYPGAHVIIRRNRGQDVTTSELEHAAKWLATETPRSKRELREGDSFDVQLAEVRFVRPIRGDRLGRVTVADPRVLRFKL